ncbi:MAG: histidinol-phosphate transaminase [Polyangiaceae bacterium]|nr:histidinol-phosphate transaminase [Polyangiaceae bacterium]
MSNLVTASIDRLRPYQAGKPIEELERELGIKDAVKLASNENPLGASPKVLAALPGLLAQIARYPDGSAHKLREAIAAFHGVSLEEVICGAGSNELLELLYRTFTTHEHHAVFGEPSFVIYRAGAMAHGVPFTAVPLTNEVHDLDAMAAAVTPKTRLLFIANPNNPTGTYVGRQAVERLLCEVPPEVIIVMDEAYVEYAEARDYPDCSKLRSLRERLVVLRTFSKVYGLASLRVGYALGPATLIDYMNRLRPPFNVGHLGQAAGPIALADQEHVKLSQSLNSSERRRMERELTALGFKVTPSQANFVWVDTGRKASELYEALLRQGVIVRPFGNFPGHLRITVGTSAENDRLFAALGKVLP